MQSLFAAQLASVSGDFIVIASLPFAVFAIGGSGGEVGIAFAVSALSEVLAVLVGGVVGDRFPRRSVMIAADLVRFASQAALAVLLIFGAAEFWQVLAVQIVQGVGFAFFNPAMGGLVPEVVSKQRLHDANALMTTAAAVGTMAGPAIAGLLIALWGVGWAFALDAFTFAVSAIVLMSIRVRPAPPRDPGPSLFKEMFEGWNEFRRRTWLWIVVLEFGVLNALVFGPFLMLGASVAVASLGGLGAWAVILTANGIGRLLGGVAALFLRPERPLFVATLLMGSWVVPLILLAVAAPLATIAITAAFAGAGLSVFEALWKTTLQTKVPEDQRSRMVSFDWLGSLGLLPIGYFVVGFGQSLISAEVTLIAGACLVLAATGIVVSRPAIRGIRADERPGLMALAASASERVA
jgi:MFS family permease